jgi:hypothetical protein
LLSYRKARKRFRKVRKDLPCALCGFFAPFAVKELYVFPDGYCNRLGGHDLKKFKKIVTL